MLALKLLATVSCLMVVCESVDPTQATQRVHPALFFSNKPALPDRLGVEIDSKTATLSCVGGSRDGRRIRYKWYKNGKLLKADSYPILATAFGDLEMKPSDFKRDDGFYRCLITDSTWSLLSNEAELRLAYISGITKRDVTSNGVQYKGWKHVFTGYTHSKYPKPKFIWKFNGRTLKENKRISISEDGNLYIAQLSLNDAGKYTFEMQLSSLKQQRESINLGVAPSTSTSDIYGTVMLGPKSKTVSLRRHKEVTFECFATGKPMPAIVWKKGSRNLVHGVKYQITDNKKRLTIKNLNKDDSGTYKCAITRTDLNKKFPEAVLTVIEPPVIKALEPANQVRHIGNYTTLTCMVTGSFSRFSLVWRRNGVRLSQSSRISMSYRTYRDYRNYTLNVSRLHQDTDGGMYQCFAKNNGGEDMAYTAVDVQSLPPYIWYGPGVVYAVLGRPAKIVCLARGSPPITYTWLKNGRAITYLDPPDNGKNGTYVIKKVRSGDVAQYTCIATNGQGPGDTHRSSGSLQLVSPTVVVNKSITIYASKGSHPYLYCGVRYDKKVNVTYKWYFKGNLIQNSRRRVVEPDGRLVIRGVYEPDGGIYRCDSTSAVGDYSTTIELVVQAPPSATTDPQVENIRPDSVQLKWWARYDGNSAIKHFNIGLRYPANGTELVIVERAMPSGIEKKYVVPGLTPYTSYQFRIRAVNSVGHSPWSGYSRVVQTTEAAPSYKMKHVQGSAVNDDTIEVTWEEPPKSTHNGVLRGYYVAWKYAGVSSGSFTREKVTPASKRKMEITELILNSPYEVKVQMFNDAGAGPFSDPVVIRTQEGLPSSAPRNLAVRNVSSRSVVLQWDAPPHQDWNGAITQYLIQLWEFDKKDDKFKQRRLAPHDNSALTQSFNVTNLKTYTQYTFEVSAQNGKGASPFSNPVQVKTTQDIPTAPRSLQIVDQFSDTIIVKWVRPREVNGVLTGYIVKSWRVSNSRDVKTTNVKGDALQAGVTGLRADTRYMIDVAAKTDAGVSKSARIEGRTQNVAVRPHAPTALRFMEINATAIELTWKEGWKGNSPIIKYIIEGNNETGFANDRNSEWFDALIVNNPFSIYNLPPVIIEDLRPATTYRFRVQAENKVGSSPFSLVSRDVTTVEDEPSSPPLNIQVRPTRDAGELSLTWELPPKESWNSPFISYTVVLHEVGDDSNFTRRVSSGINGHTRSYKLPSLKKFTSYEIRMKSVNRIGDSPYSPVIIGQTQEYVPGAQPSNIRAIGASGSSMDISWGEVPKEGRNGKVLGYKLFHRLVQYAPQDFTEIDLGDVRQYTLKNLLGYTQYDIRILAYTKIGDGKLSDPLFPYPRTLETKPGPPSKLRFPTISPAAVTMTWGAPELTGGNITQYRVRYKLRDDSSALLITRPTLAARRRSETVTNLALNKFYIFGVQAFTAVGWGEEASAEIFTSLKRNLDVPETPIILPISDSHITWRSILVRWGVGRRRNQPIRYFTLKLRKGQGAWETHPKPLSDDDDQLVVWGLESNHIYSFQITATNDAGTSPPSKPSPPVRTLKKSLPGSPREVRITSSIPTTFRVTWKPPSLVDMETTIKRYRLGYRLHEKNPASNPNYLDIPLPSTARSHVITGLREYTLYDIRLNAVDVNEGNLPSYLETRRTSSELPPRPSLSDSPGIGPTSLTISWSPPAKTETPVLGYKAVYETPSRRRRAVSEYCETPEPGVAYFANTSSKGTIRNLQMFTRYEIVLKSFNVAGESPPSEAISARTAEGEPGPPAVFDFDGVYDVELHVYWKAPCQANGVIIEYILTVSNERKQIQERKLGENVRTYKVSGLARVTDYKLELVARTSGGRGIAKVLETRTKPAAVLPSPPKIMHATAQYNAVTLTWINGHHGNSPITKYIIEYRTSTEKNPWVQGWSLSPSETTKNRTGGTTWVVLRDLEPNTEYWFRMKVQNKVGVSVPGDSSQSVATDSAVPTARSSPIYEEIWFIAVMAVIGFLILLFLCICIVCLCCRRRRRDKDLRFPVEMELQSNTGLRPYSSFDETLSNGGSKSRREEKPLVDDSDQGEEEEEEEASSLETKSDVEDESDESEDDIATKKSKMAAAFREEEKYYPPKSYSTDQLHNSPPPAYATFASTRNKGRSEPVLDPYADIDDDDVTDKPYRPPTRRSAFEPYDGESSDGSEVANRKRGDPRSSSFRRALVTAGGPSQPEPERPYEPQPNRRPTPRKYRSLEKAVNENAKPPSYHDDDDDDETSSRSRQASLPPEYRSDSGRDSSDEHDRMPLTHGSSRYNPRDRAESPAPAYHSDDSLSSDKHRLTDGRPKPQPEISSYSSFV